MESPLVQLTSRCFEFLDWRLTLTLGASNWVEHPDMTGYLQMNVFSAAVEALCGLNLVSQSPIFVDCLWEVVAQIYMLTRCLPRATSLKAYRSRNRSPNAI